MSEKNYDDHNRLRSKTIAFRVSPEEDKQINTVGHESIYITLHYSHAFKDVEGDIAQSLDREMNKAMEAEKPDAETR